MVTVHILTNPVDSTTWETHETDNVCRFLAEYYPAESGGMPSGYAIYRDAISEATDITPRNESVETDVAALLALSDGTHVFVVLWGGHPAVIVAAVLILALIASVVLRPAIPTPAIRNTQQQSANNELAGRTNKPRMLARIPDIYGTVSSTPDLVAQPYRLFRNNEEVEYAYMCIGRGEYAIDGATILDGETSIANIYGSSVEVYGPYTSPNNTTVPQVTVGAPIATPVLDVTRSNAVTGQVLRAPNENTVKGDNNIFFTAPNVIHYNQGTDNINMADFFEEGDQLTVTNAIVYAAKVVAVKDTKATTTGDIIFTGTASDVPNYLVGATIILSSALYTKSGGVSPTTYSLNGLYSVVAVSTSTAGAVVTFTLSLSIPSELAPMWAKVDSTLSEPISITANTGEIVHNLSGTYSVLSVSNSDIMLDAPAVINPAWSSITTTPTLSPTLSTEGPKWVGPFILARSTTANLLANFIATNGLYKDDGTAQYATSVTVEVEATPIDTGGTAIGPPSLHTITLVGSSVTKAQQAVTLEVTLPFVGRCSIRARRVTELDTVFSGTVVDEVRWRDVYMVAPVAAQHFGNVTTVQSVTRATTGALVNKERKLNMLVTRKVLMPDGSLLATSRADHVIRALSLDPFIGRRNINELDMEQITATVTTVRDYFGTDEAIGFNYTFDSSLSFEETVQAVANAVFCTAYRRGSVLRLSPELATDDSRILFNHRNKLPQSETRTVRFGSEAAYDGVAYKYVDPIDDAIVTKYIPADQSSTKTKEIESLGVRSHLQAHFHAWRMYQKLVLQNTVTTFTTTQEAAVLLPLDRILVADNTRAATQDGEVIAQDGLALELSQPFAALDNVAYTIYLQLYDGTVESMPIQPVTGNSFSCMMQRPPRLPLALDDDLYARTSYIITSNEDRGATAFLLSEKEPNADLTYTIKAVNYDARFYAYDLDWATNIVDANGDTV